MYLVLVSVLLYIGGANYVEYYVHKWKKKILLEIKR